MTPRMRNTYARIIRLQKLGAPKWIVNNEKLILLKRKFPISDEMYETLLEKHVRAYMDGVGYVTVPDSI